jgi:hypothetical protein
MPCAVSFLKFNDIVNDDLRISLAKGVLKVLACTKSTFSPIATP